MDNLLKPSLPIGWLLRDSAKILKRIDKQQFVEVFSLDNGCFLYLFHDESVIKKIKDRALDYEKFDIAGREALGMRYSYYQQGSTIEILKSIRERRGLDAIAGMATLKTTLIRDIIQPFLNWEKYEQYGVFPSNGILFFGPPGCGKTFIARKIAEAIHAEMIEISEGSVGSPYIHATSTKIADAFRRAQQQAPCVVFIDEISGLMPKRENLSSSSEYRESEIGEFLIHMEDAVKKRILVIGATNFPERIDPAILRSGRIDKKIFIPPPDKESRLELFKLFLEGRPLAEDICFDKLAEATEGYISSDIKLIVNSVALNALQNNSPITMNFLIDAIDHFTPSLTTEDLKRYEQFTVFKK